MPPNPAAPTLEVFFARQTAGTGIASHTDDVNFIQTSHLGLRVPEGDCWMKVGGRAPRWARGRAGARGAAASPRFLDAPAGGADAVESTHACATQRPGRMPPRRRLPARAPAPPPRPRAAPRRAAPRRAAPRPQCGDGEPRKWARGRAITMDTSFMHSTWNGTQEDRYVLIMRHWHPGARAPARAAARPPLPGATEASRFLGMR